MTDQDKSPRRARSAFRADGSSTGLPGGRLINALWATMNERHDTPAQLAEVLGVTYVYLMMLARGDKPVPALKHDVLVRAAEYLGIPTVQAFLWAGIIQPSDFVRAGSLPEKIKAVRRAMLTDPIWSGYAGTEEDWDATPIHVQLFACLLYERAARTQFFSDVSVDFDEAVSHALSTVQDQGSQN